MFNIGIGELFFIALLVLVVVGPERLPGIMREIGKYTYQLRTIVNELTDQFADELRPIQEIQQLADDLNPVRQVTKVAMSTAEPPKRSEQATTPLAKPEAPPAASSPAPPPVAGPTLVKPTAAFRAKPASSSANPMKVISQARNPSSTSSDSADSDS